MTSAWLEKPAQAVQKACGSIAWAGRAGPLPGSPGSLAGEQTAIWRWWVGPQGPALTGQVCGDAVQAGIFAWRA